MTFAPIHDFLPRKFPTENDGNLPAFVTDRQTEDNPWLQEIFTGKKIPTATTSTTAIN
jgi:hypothetical protein